MLRNMLVTRGKMQTNAGQGCSTPGNAEQDAGDEGKDANKRWARLQGNATQDAGDEGKDDSNWARLDTRQRWASCW